MSHLETLGGAAIAALLSLAAGGCGSEPAANQDAARSAPAQGLSNDSVAAARAEPPAPPTQMAAKENTEAVSAEQGRAKADSAGAPDLQKYVGLYHFDKVDGVTFTGHPAVQAQVRQAVPEKAAQKWLLSLDVGSVPITLEGPWIVYSASENHASNVHNWKIMMSRDGASSRVCYFQIPKDDSDYLKYPWEREHQASWYYDGSVHKVVGPCL